MHNRPELTQEEQQLELAILKHKIREALKDGSGFAKDLAQRAGVPHGKEFVRALHEMEDDMVISFTWLRGYRNE